MRIGFGTVYKSTNLIDELGMLSYLLVKFGKDIRRMKRDEGLSNQLGHLVDGACMRPVRIVNRSEGNTVSLNPESVVSMS